MADSEIARQSVRGSAILFIGNFLSALLLALAVIAMARLLGPAQYGAYSISFVIPETFLIFTGLGTQVAVTRYAAHYLSVGKPDEARRFTVSAIEFQVLVGLAFTVTSFFLSPYLTAVLLRQPNLALFTQEASIVLLGQTLLGVATSAAVGWNAFGVTSIATIFQAASKLLLVVSLLLLGFGVFGAVLGHVSSFLLAGLLCVLWLYLSKLRGADIHPAGFVSDVEELLRYGFPVFVAGAISGLAAQYVSVVLALIASNAIYGVFRAATNLLTPLTIVSTAVSFAFLRAFASLHGSEGKVESAFTYAVKYTGFLVTPIIFYLLGGAQQLFDLLYGTSYSLGVPFLQLLALANVPMIVGLGVFSSFFNGIGKTRYVLVTSILGTTTLVILTPTLAIFLRLGVQGLIYSALMSNVTTVAVGILIAARSLRAPVDFRSGVLMALCGVLACGGLLALNRVSLWTPVAVLLDLVVLSITYFTLAPLLGALDQNDIERIRNAASGIWFVGRFAELLMDYESFVIRWRIEMLRSFRKKRGELSVSPD